MPRRNFRPQKPAELYKLLFVCIEQILRTKGRSKFIHITFILYHEKGQMAIKMIAKENKRRGFSFMEISQRSVEGGVRKKRTFP